MLTATLFTAAGVLFEGEAGRVILPGEQGIFEIAPYHKTLVSRLLPGNLFVDEKRFSINHGVVKVKGNRVVAMVELNRDSA